MKRQSLFTFGQRPVTVNCYRLELPSGRVLVRVEWRENGRRKTRSWDDSAEARRNAKAAAKELSRRLQNRGATAVARISVGALFDKYVLANEPTWRRGTLKNARSNWRLFQEVVGPATFADLVTQETLDEVRAALRKRGIAPNQIRACITRVKAVWAWARPRRLLTENVLSDYKNALPKDGPPLDVPEYSPDEVAALMEQLSPRGSRTWRTWAAVLFAAIQGPRQNALLHLEWRDIDFDGRTVTWRAEFDKLGRQRDQALTRDAVRALRVAMVWRRRMGYDGPFVFPAVQERRRDKPWTYAALAQSLREAEIKAGIAHFKFRGMHGLRRHACRTVLDQTSDINKAAEWIGDNDLRTLKRSYLKPRPQGQRELARTLRMPTRKAESAVAVATEQQSFAKPSIPRSSKPKDSNDLQRATGRD